jgi:4-amino-4-deoxy-L-arabinose transferase-like glycosyltransferase
MSLGVLRLRDPAAKWTILSVTVIVFLTAAVRVPLLGVPFERDEGEYAYIAWRLGHHELPYRDWIDQKPPGIFWIYRLALQLPLDPIYSIHCMGLLFSATSAGALFFLARRFMSRPWAAGAAALFAILSADPLVQGTAANTELFMLLPLILSQLAFLSAAANDQRRILLLILAGALTGIAVAFKQVAAINWLFQLVLWPIMVAGEKRLRTTLSFAGWSAAGAGVVWGSIAIYFFLRQGLGDLVDNVFTHNLEYLHTIPWRVRLRFCMNTLAILARTQALVWILSAAGLIAMCLTGRMKCLLFLAGWMVTSMVGVGASGYFFPHYFQQLLPALSLMAALGAEALYGAHFLKRNPVWSRAAIVSTLSVIMPVVVIYPFLFTYTPAEAVKRIYPDNFFAEMPALGRRIARVTGPDDRVFIFGAEAELLFYAQRVSATRYIFLFPLYGPYRNARERQMAATREISLNRPAAAVWFPNQLFFLPGSEQFFTGWTQSYLKENFQIDAYFTANQNGTADIIPSTGHQDQPVPDGQAVIGATFVRKNR